MRKTVSFVFVLCALLMIQTLVFASFYLGYDSPVLTDYYEGTDWETVNVDATFPDINLPETGAVLNQYKNQIPNISQRGFSSLHSEQEIDAYIIATSMREAKPFILEQTESESSSESFNDANSHLLLSFEQNANISSQLPVSKASKIDFRTSSSFYELGYDSPALSDAPDYIATLTRSELSDSSDDNFEITRGVEIYCSFSSSENSELGHSPKSPQTV